MGFILREQKGSKLTIQEMDGNLEFLYNLDQLKLFKPGSVSDKVSFTKVSGTAPATNKDVIIPGELEITRGNSGGGIFNIAVEPNYNSSNNSPENTFWNTIYVDDANVNWAPLWDIPSRSFTDWRAGVSTNNGNKPPMYVGLPAVMKWDNGSDPVRYWLIMFTHWGANGDDYGFAYDRYEIFSEVSFQQPSSNNTNTPNVIDIISDGVHITRNYTGGGLYNAVNETYSIDGVSPLNTRWNSSYTDGRLGYSGFGDLSNLDSRIYTDFVSSLDGSVGSNIIGEDLIMYDMTTDVYYKVVFNSWAAGCGGNGAPGRPTSWSITNAGSGYPDGGYWSVDATGGSGIDPSVSVLVTGGVPTTIEWNGGENYQVGNVITLNYPGVTNPTVITLTAVCSMGGFSYTRTAIPQSNRIKFADGSFLSTGS